MRARVLLAQSTSTDACAQALVLLQAAVAAEEEVAARCGGAGERFAQAHEGEISRFLGRAAAYGALGALQVAMVEGAGAVDSLRRGLCAAEAEEARLGQRGAEASAAAALALSSALLTQCRGSSGSGGAAAAAAAAAECGGLLRRCLAHFAAAQQRARRGGRNWPRAGCCRICQLQAAAGAAARVQCARRTGLRCSCPCRMGRGGGAERSCDCFGTLSLSMVPPAVTTGPTAWLAPALVA